MKPDKDISQWDRDCDSFVEDLIDKAIQEKECHSLRNGGWMIQKWRSGLR